MSFPDEWRTMLHPSDEQYAMQPSMCPAFSLNKWNRRAHECTRRLGHFDAHVDCHTGGSWFGPLPLLTVDHD